MFFVDEKQNGAPALSLKLNMLWNSAGSITNLACQWLISIVIVRISSGYDAAGLYSLAMAIYGMISPLGQYRMYTYQVTDVRKENSTGEYLTLRFITISMALLLIATYAYVTCSFEAVLVTISYSLYRFVALAIDVFHACDQCNHRMDYIGKSLAVQGFLSISFFTLLFCGTGNLFVTFLGMGFVLLVWGAVYDYRRARQFGPIEIGISASKAGHLLRVCFPVVAASVVASSAPLIPRQVLAACFGDASLGIYASAAAPVAIIQMGVSYIYNPLMGYFAEYYAKESKHEFRRLFAKCVGAMCLVCVVAVAGVLLLGEPVLVFLYGDSIAAYSYLLFLLVPLAVLTGFMWFLNDLLIALRGFKSALMGNVVALVAVIPSLSLVFVFDMNGVSLACLVSSTVGSAFMLFALVLLLRRGRDKKEW